MSTFLISLIIGVFLAILFLNIFFRVRIFKIYKRLVANKVEFESKHVFSSKKMESEILPRYPEQRDDIIAFSKNIKLSVNIAALLIVLITVAGLILRGM